MFIIIFIIQSFKNDFPYETEAYLSCKSLKKIEKQSVPILKIPNVSKKRMRNIIHFNEITSNMNVDEYVLFSEYIIYYI